MRDAAYRLDPAFAAHRARLIARERRTRLARGASVVASVAALVLAGWLVGADRHVQEAETDAAQPREAPEFVVADADMRRAPLLLPRAAAEASARNRFELRFRNRSSAIETGGRVFYVADRMIGDTLRIGAVLPANPQDFAMMALGAELGAADGEVVRGEQPGASDPGSGSTVLAVLPPDRRRPVYRDVVIKTLGTRSVGATLREAGVAPAAAERIADDVARSLNQRELSQGAVTALRFAPIEGDRSKLVQLSIYDRSGRIGSLGIDGQGSYLPVDADPWRSRALADLSQSEGTGRLRVMDGLYAAGIRNGVPPAVITETLIHMARHHDMGQFIDGSDTFQLLYSERARDGDGRGGQVLYASVERAGEQMVCYVLKPSADSDPTCLNENDLTAEPLGPAGFVTPVAGVMRSGFGPRRHPILGTVRLHAGVDWAAPSGTPIKAAFDGRIVQIGVRGGYGNYIRLDHGSDRETAYAHMSRFARGMRNGRRVRAGEVIGYVGTTGQSTGPHLHFELIENGRAVDPLTAEVRGPAEGSATAQLVQQIIKVESGGRADARNPLSSATGLGQFIDSTWLRMMRSYRPELVRTMSRHALLDLRYEPSIAREMTRNLALENAAELRRAGNRVTAGNLYLAHFLGYAGANRVLRADPDLPLVNVVGRGVISANPFLRGRDTQWVVDWAARKMTGKGAPVRARRRLAEPLRIKNSRLKVYSTAIDALLERIEAARSRAA